MALPRERCNHNWSSERKSICDNILDELLKPSALHTLRQTLHGSARLGKCRGRNLPLQVQHAEEQKCGGVLVGGAGGELAVGAAASRLAQEAQGFARPLAAEAGGLPNKATVTICSVQSWRAARARLLARGRSTSPLGSTTTPSSLWEEATTPSSEPAPAGIAISTAGTARILKPHKLPSGTNSRAPPSQTPLLSPPSLCNTPALARAQRSDCCNDGRQAWLRSCPAAETHMRAILETRGQTTHNACNSQ